MIGPLTARILYNDNDQRQALRRLCTLAAEQGQSVRVHTEWIAPNWWFEVEIGPVAGRAPLPASPADASPRGAKRSEGMDT